MSLNLGQSFEKFRETVGISVGWTSVDGIREATENPDESPQCYLWFWEETPEKPTRSETNSSQLNHWSRKISFLLKDGLLAASISYLFGGRVFIIPQISSNDDTLWIPMSSRLNSAPPASPHCLYEVPSRWLEEFGIHPPWESNWRKVF